MRVLISITQEILGLGLHIESEEGNKFFALLFNLKRTVEKN